MRRYIWFIIPIFLSSCFASRQSPKNSNVLGVDPIELSIDTTKIIRIDTTRELIDSTVSQVSDSLVVIQDTIDSLQIETEIDTSGFYADSLAQVAAEMIRLEALASLDTVTVIGTGDIMPGTNFPDSRYLPPGNNCSKLFAPVAEVLRSADVTFGNLEGVFCSEGGTAKKCRDPKVCYVFRMPDEYLECILDAGYDVLSVANNHVNDFGLEGRISTARVLENAGVPFAGFQSRKSAVFEKNGVTYGFAAFAPHQGTLNLKDYNGAAEIVRGLDTICDIVIVSFHGGAEGRDYQHVPCTDEEYLGYNRGNVCKFSHAVVDAGADVVFGHGPHVTRAMELYKDRLICYSLGNFCTYARFNLSGPNGIAPIVRVKMNKQGAFLEGKVIPVYQPGEGGPRIDPQNRVIAKLKDLSKIDFPESKLIINDDGYISTK